MALRFVGGATATADDNLLTKVVTLDASSMPLNAPPPAEMLGYCARSRLKDAKNARMGRITALGYTRGTQRPP